MQKRDLSIASGNEKLPAGLLTAIFRSLDFQTANIASQACRFWHGVSKAWDEERFKAVFPAIFPDLYPRLADPSYTRLMREIQAPFNRAV